MATQDEPKSDLNLDAVLGELGSGGPFHIRIYCLLMVPVMLFSMYDMTYLFTSAGLDYRCKIPECEANATTDIRYEQAWLSNVLPIAADGRPRQCERFARIDNNAAASETCSAGSFNKSHTDRCTEFVYEDTVAVTLVNEFNITCPENEWMLSGVGSLGYFADIIMLPLHGWLSDRFGRRMMIIISLFFVCTLGMAKSFATSYVMYAILKFALCLCTPGAFTTLFIMTVEWVVPSNRVLAGLLICLGYSFGQISLGCIAAYVLNFRWLLRVLYAPAYIVLGYMWLVPESLHWMHNKGQHERVRRTIEQAASLNQVTLSEQTMLELNKSIELAQTRSANVVEDGLKSSPTSNLKIGQTIFTSKRLFGRLLICVFVMFTMSMIYTGLNVHSQTLEGSRFSNYILVNLVEIPANIIAYFVMIKSGRRMPFSLSLITTGLLCIASELIPESHPMVASIRLILCMASKLSVTVCYSIAFVYISELFPTQLRQSFMNGCYAMSCMGSMLAPQIRLLDLYYPSMAMYVFAGVAAMASALIMLLPDTYDVQLPDTIEEAENIGRKVKNLTDETAISIK